MRNLEIHMKNLIVSSLTFLILIGCTQPKIETPLGYNLVWSDEFEKDGAPNTANWNYEHGFVRNHEFQWYQPENAFCENGLLVIEGRQEKKENPNFEPESQSWKESREFADFTSSCLITKNLHSWQFGIFEIRARFKTDNGLWPAAWFLGVDGKWPYNGEIDLIEYYRNTLLGNACWGSDEPFKAKWDDSRKPIESFNDPSWDEKFHVWRMDWDENRIELYVDHFLLNTIDLKETLNPDGKGPKNPFHQPHYFLVNLAIGGDSGGDPSKTEFPTRYEVDYVRVFQKVK